MSVIESVIGPAVSATAEGLVPVSRSLWTPAEIATGLWLDASDASTITDTAGEVDTWADKSGNGRNATSGVNKPSTGARTLNGLNVIDFNGTSDSLTISPLFQPGANNSMSFIILVNDEPSPPTARYLNGYFGVATRFGLSGRSNGNNYIHASSFLPVASTYSQSDNIISGYKNGTEQGVNSNFGTFSTNSNGGITPPLDSIWMGSNRGVDDFYDGAIGEAIVVLDYDFDNLQRIEGYLAHKWGLESNLPSDHPYKTVAP